MCQPDMRLEHVRYFWLLAASHIDNQLCLCERPEVPCVDVVPLTWDHLGANLGV